MEVFIDGCQTLMMCLYVPTPCGNPEAAQVLQECRRGVLHIRPSGGPQPVPIIGITQVHYNSSNQLNEMHFW